MFSISLVSAFYYGYLLIAVFSLKHIFKANYILAPILHEKQLFVYAYLFVYKNFMGRVDGGIAPSAPHRIPDLRLSRIRLFTRLID